MPRKKFYAVLSLFLILLASCSQVPSSIETVQDTTKNTERSTSVVSTSSKIRHITIGISPVAKGTKDSLRGLRSVFFYTDKQRLLEPPALGPDGPISESAFIEEDVALKIIEILAQNNVFENAEKYYSNRVADPKNPPPQNALPIEKQPSRPKNPYWVVELRMTEKNHEDWYVNQESYLPLGSGFPDILRSIQPVLDKEDANNIKKLLETLQYYP